MKLRETDCQSTFVESGPCEGEAKSNAGPALESASGGEGADTTLSKLQKCQIALGYTFKDVSFLESALIHTSCKLEYNGSNERLEFMGDAILGMVISEHLYKAFPEYCEGELTRIKSVVVSQTILARVGDRLNLGEYVVVGKGLPERKSFPRSLIANVFEAIIAAIYLDGGLSAAKDFVVSQLGEEIARVCHSEHEGNYKSLLQQHCQKHLGTTPHYRLIHQHGPEHGKTFEVAVIIKDAEYRHGKGKSKKQAEQLAAEATYRELTQQERPVGAG
ncbi:MAG TPA: ribonuclease III [Candidatus Tripitaka californicus]|uniref:ribonuclease III n=1 Tax=Candidatus Tripitaka californicus TaxID=3367616 RepID=UPI004026A600|nr:ribonuclease III [Planctomycetota bacterium]